MTTYSPRPYQQLITDHTLSVKRGNTWAGMGLGKTVATLTALEWEYRVGVRTQPTLVLAPVRVAQSTWPDEQAKWDHLSGLEVVPIMGSPAQRAALMRRDAPVFTINYEKIPWLIEWFKNNPRPWPFSKVIADESTKLKSTRVDTRVSRSGKEFTRSSGGSVRGAALQHTAHSHITSWRNLTGLAAPNGLKDLWGQQWFVDKGDRLGRSYTAFQNRWFRRRPGGGNFAPMEPTENAMEEVRELLTDCTLALDPKDWFDLREPINQTVYVDLPAPARKMYRDMEKNFFAELGAGRIDAANTGAKTMKCLQIASGAVYTDGEGAWEEVHDAKIQALDSIVSESGGAPILVAYHFKTDLTRLQRAFPKGVCLGTDPKTIKDWNAGRIPILFAHPDSAGHGLNLQDGGNILVFFSHWWALEPYAQILERIGPVRQMQAGHNRPVFVYHIVARDTFDEEVIERRTTKREVNDILIGAMKRRGS